MKTTSEVLKALGEAREMELLGNRDATQKEDLRFSYIVLRSLLDPKYRERALATEGLSSEADRALRGSARPKAEELLRTDDAKLLWPTVMQNTIIEPREPVMIGQDVIADQVRVDGSGSTVEWLSTDAIVAHFVDEAEGPGEEDISFTRHMSSAKIKKAMVAVGITDEMVADCQYDLMGLQLRACSNALRRKKEEWIWNKAWEVAYTVFDNGGGPSLKGDTTGLDSAGAANHTMTHLDFVDLLVGPVVNGFQPDTVIFHPLHFPAFVKDPLVRELLQFAWPKGQALPGPSAIQANLGFALTAYMSPFVTSNVKSRTASTDVITASVMALQASEALLLITRQDPTVKEWSDPRIDVLRTNVRERYGVGVKHKGQAIAIAKAVSTATNYGPIQLQKTVS